MAQDKRNKVPLIEVENMKKYYPIKGGIITHTTGYVKAVDGVSFSVMEGETLGLVGESGCGKSTIGRQIVGLENPTEGKIYYDGKDLAACKPGEMKKIRTQLQMVFQDSYSSLNPRKHIYEILSQPMLYHHISTPATVSKDVDRILDMVGLSRNVLGRYPHEFSGGQRQRIGIARALAVNPEFLLCDEPISALDVSVQAQVVNLLVRLKKERGLTCMFIAHDLSMVKYISDRVGVMYLGCMAELADADELYENPLHPYTKALLSAIPVPNPEIEKGRPQIRLEGEVPSPVNPPQGCHFCNRCPSVKECCRYEKPELREAAPGHFVACHLYNSKA